MDTQLSPNLTNFTSVIVLIMKECRIEQGIHQAQMAEKIGKSPSTLTKMELGQSQLTMDIFLNYCSQLYLSSTAVISAAERYTALLRNNGWNILNSALPLDEDKLFAIAQEYYSNPEQFRTPDILKIPVLNGPVYNMDNTVTGSIIFLISAFPTYKQFLIDQYSQRLLNNL